MKPILVSSGEPAGVGPDLCLELANLDIPLVILGDLKVLQERSTMLNKRVDFKNYDPLVPLKFKKGVLNVYPISCKKKVIPGRLDSANSLYVLELLETAAAECAKSNFSAVVTAPVHKAIINAAGFPFTGHTEFFAKYFNIETVVMLLSSSKMKVALVTTHLPLRQVSGQITKSLIKNVIKQLNNSLCKDFNIENPIIKVAGLNPHAGESGYLGTEEIEIITPALSELKLEGINVHGPYPADTLFIPEQIHSCDAFIAMYHDQGLPVIKHAYFNEAVNITLGLPIIRTSVDHGTAENLAGKNIVDPGSMIAAVETAFTMAYSRLKHDY